MSSSNLAQLTEPIGYSGAMERQQAEKVLGGRPVGTFLTRWSPNAKTFVLSYVGKFSVVSHIGKIIPANEDENYCLNSPVTVTTETNREQKYENLVKFIQAMRNSGRIKNPIDKRLPVKRQINRRETYEVISLDTTSNKSLTTEETELINFLQENNLDEYVDSFIAHGFDIETVRYITKDVLVDLEITQIATQLKILECIKKLKGEPQEKPIYLTHIKIGKQLGEGQGGKVFRGVWYNSTHVALKALHLKSMEPSIKERENFQKELKVLMQVNHPSILRFLGLYRDNGIEYIVTEYMEKGTLLDVLKNETFTVDQLLKMAKDIASGMVYLEQKKIVHRDLSCRNCLVGAGGEVKIGDFGMSRIVETNYSTMNRVIPYKWCSFESLDKGIWTHKSDVWSYGITLWELFSRGAEPYPTKKANEIENLLREGIRPEKPSGCSDQIYEMMRSCWEKEPNKRPNFQALYNTIENLISPNLRLSSSPVEQRKNSSDNQGVQFDGYLDSK